MILPLQLKDPGKLLSGAQADHVADRVRKLTQFCRWIRRCRVVVEGPGQHPLPGRYRIRICLVVGRTRILITRRAGEDLAMAIRDSFDAADQRVQDHVRVSRGIRSGAPARPTRRPRTRDDAGDGDRRSPEDVERLEKPA